MSELREEVRRRYAESALAVTGGTAGCCGDSCCTTFYDDEERVSLPESATLASLGCGNPTAVAELRAGEVVLDLGSGGGIDVILSARRVGPAGTAYGLDMTDEMLALARRNAAEAGVTNVHFLKGVIEEIPLPAESVDVVISNCVINLSVDKPAVLAEIARVLKPGGRIGISDIVAEDPLIAGAAGRARELRRLHRGRAVEGRVRGGPGGGRIRADRRHLYLRGRGRHARRDRQGRERRLARTVSVGAVLETLHGVEVADPFRWLEETDAPEVESVDRGAERGDAGGARRAFRPASGSAGGSTSCSRSGCSRCRSSRPGTAFYLRREAHQDQSVAPRRTTACWSTRTPATRSSRSTGSTRRRTAGSSPTGSRAAATSRARCTSSR